jgi:hypothetical protein
VGLIARVLEEAGIATVCIIMRREVAENVKPPRALFVKFPFGAPLGPAGDAETQRGVISGVVGAGECDRARHACGLAAGMEEMRRSSSLSRD